MSKQQEFLLCLITNHYSLKCSLPFEWAESVCISKTAGSRERNNQFFLSPEDIFIQKDKLHFHCSSAICQHMQGPTNLFPKVDRLKMENLHLSGYF